MRRTLATIAAATGATLTGSGDGIPGGYSIDSRTCRKGDLFFAIVGPNHDGHRFLKDAAARGACGLVVSDPSAVPDALAGVPVLRVEDTLRALQDLAAAVRRAMSVRVVGITGSGGKTTTKEMTRAALEASFRVHASRGNLNNLYGCPLSILEIGPDHQVSVLEMGMSFPGELTRLAEIADPDIGILTNVSAAHRVNFASVEEIARAKQELFDGMRADSIGCFNADDEQCRRIMSAFNGYACTFGIDREADLRASGYRMNGLRGCSFEVAHASNGSARRVEVTLRFVGVHHVYNALAALSAGFMLGIDLEAMVDRLSRLEPLGMRGRVVRLKGPIDVLDDSYNSNPAALRAVLRVISEAAPGPGGRRVVVFGDMLELGEGEEEDHREAGRAIASSGVALVVGVGPLSAAALEAARAAGQEEIRHCADADEAARFVTQSVRPGDVVLVKASRGIGLDRVVAALKERFGEE